MRSTGELQRHACKLWQDKQSVGPRHQSGAGLIVTLFILVALSVFGMVALKCLPAYLELWTIEATVHRIAHDPLMQSDLDRRTAFDRQSKIDRIESITSRDLLISGNQISVSYTRTVPLLDHVSLLLDFNVSSDN